MARNKKNPSGKKDLLTEATVRRFMKLANINPVGGLMGRRSMLREEKEEDEELPTGEPDGDEAPEPDMGSDIPPVESEDELGGLDTGAPSSLEGIDQDKVEQLVNAIADAITDVTGVSVNVSDGGADTGDSDTDLPVPDEGGDMGGDMPPMESEPGGDESAVAPPVSDEEEKPLDEAKELVSGKPKKVDGSHKDHTMKDMKVSKKNMVNEIVSRVSDKVYNKLLEQLKKDKVIPSKPATTSKK